MCAGKYIQHAIMREFIPAPNLAGNACAANLTARSKPQRPRSHFNRLGLRGSSEFLPLAPKEQADLYGDRDLLQSSPIW
jgi:hypothetical protein